jgi:hypothetical protein
VGVTPSIAYIATTDTEAQVLVTGYLNQVVESGLYSFSLPCMACVSTVASAGAQPKAGWYDVAYITTAGTPYTGIWSLVPIVSPGGVTLPTIPGDFAIFSDTAGTLEDLGYSPSNAALAKVVMESGASIVGDIPKYNDVNGTIMDSGITAACISALLAQLPQLYEAVVTLTPTQMAAAYANPANLIANPLSSQMIVVHSANIYTASTGNTAYATGTAPIIQYGTGGTNGAHGAGTIATAAGFVAGDITAAASQVRTLLQLTSAAFTGLSGKGIYFSNATGAYTAGTGTNVTFTLIYELLTATV